MSTGPTKYPVAQRSHMPVFGSYNGSQASLRLEKSNPGLRRSTPDSEALASSDEELDHVRLRGQATTKPINTTRRTFSYAEQPTVHRKPSMTASGTYSPTASNPGTPAAEQNPWPTMSPSSQSAWGGGSSGYPWTGSIWSQESRKEPPARLQEMHANESNKEIPFSIPVQPTMKTYRSQSYSVGQLEQNTNGQALSNNTSVDNSRARGSGQFPLLQRRSSRPGMMANTDIGALSGVREDDGEETLDVTQRNVEQAREIERLEQENARLRAEQRQRTMSSTAAMHLPPPFRSTQIRGAVPEEGDLAIDDQYDDGSFGNYNFVGPGRRYSEQLQHPERQPSSPADNRLSRWQTVSGSTRLTDIPQSRRHSFAADAPTRHGSFGSQDAESTAFYENNSQEFLTINDPMYFKLDEKRRLEAEASVQQGLSYNNPYNYAPYGSSGQTFVIVNFKCCRSDIFYVQDGTGLQIQVGDLVVVDADRGTDLGAVQHVHVTLEEARRYKEYYAEEHYKLLMMFSQQTKNGGMNAVNPNGPSTRQSAVGGMGPQAHGHREGHNDPKAKMIKRLAQAHEIQALKEKEGNEAKAKRVCSSKVVEHGLNMEILDAEFQMDNKKLTFYYFADEYINFNALVTDLFKIYKTRIWMSAINPASFQTPTSSLGISPAYGNTALPLPMTDSTRVSPYPGMGGSLSNPYDIPKDTRPRGVMSPPYYPAYQSQLPVGQRGGSDLNGYPGNVPPTIDPFSPYSAQNFGMFNQAAPGFGMPRQDPRSGNTNQSPNQAWLSQFQGLSMGS